ncbi:putative protein YqeN [Clostridiales bacterium]|nr:putative protein YqeN [Clostridiales bacterium]
MKEEKTMAKLDLKNKIENCYLLYGVDTFSRKLYEDRIKKIVINKADDMMNTSTFNNIKTTAGQIIEAAETMPFLCERRFILVKDCGFFSEGKKAESDLLAEYIQNIPETACIVFSEEKADKRLKLYKAVVKYGLAESFDGLKDAELADMIGKKFAKKGLKAAKSVCIYIVRSCNGDTELIKNESDKLIDYLDGKKEVTVADVDTICQRSPDTKVFALVDAMIAKNADKALEIFRNLLSLNESPFMVLSLITRQFRIILKCKSLEEKGTSANDIAKAIGAAPFVANGALKQAREFSYKSLHEALNKCLKMDYMIKSGGIDAASGVEIIIAGGEL